MTKLFNNKLFIALLALFMTVCALLGITATLPRPAKAATAETNAITSADDFKDISEYTRKPFEYGADISGKLIYWYTRNCSPTSSDLSGFCLGTTSGISMQTVDGALTYSFGGAMSLDDENLMMTKCVQNDGGQDIGVMIYCPGDVVTLADGAYSFDPSTGFTADGSTLPQGCCCYLAELVERTDTSKYVENDYTLGETIPAGTIVRFKTSEVAKSGNIQFLKGDKEIFINLYTEEIAFWGSNVDLMETLDGALVVNRSETFVDVYFENEITIEMIQTEGYTVHTLTAPAKEEPSEDKGGFLEDVQDWFNNAGDDVAEWLGDNTGIAITGGGVLTIGAIIIIVLALRKRR